MLSPAFTRPKILLLASGVVFIALMLTACGGFAAPASSGITPYVVVVTPTRQPATLTAAAQISLQASLALTPTIAPTLPPASTALPNAALTSTAAPKPTASLAVTDNKYTVKPGDTLIGVAIRLGVDYDELVDLNDISDPNSLKIDQVLKIPPRKIVVPTPTK